MKPMEKMQSAELLMPDYGIAVKQAAARGIDRNEQDIYFGKVKRCFSEGEEKAEFCWCADIYESEKMSADISPHEYRKRIICVSAASGSTDIYAAQDVEVEEIKTGNAFEYNGVPRMLPRRKAQENPYVLSLADALEMFHKFGFIKAEIGDIFIGTFSFKNFNEEDSLCPEWRRHFGIGLCYMIEVVVDGALSVAVICAFNETRPKTVICNPLELSVIRPYQLGDTFRTVCGRMTLVNGVMTPQR